MVDLPSALAVFIAGFLMFLAPCTFPLVPGYLGFLSGATHHHLLGTCGTRAGCRRRLLVLGALFSLGFSIVFVLVGTGIGFVGSFLRLNRFELFRWSGWLIVLLGLMVMGVFKLPFWQTDRRVRLPQSLRRPGKLSAFLFGAAFSLGWSPCVGPILGSVLTLTAVSGSAASGAWLLTVFSAGLALPFILVALFAAEVASRMDRMERYVRWASIGGGVLLVFFGLALAFGQYAVLTDLLTGWYANLAVHTRLMQFY